MKDGGFIPMHNQVLLQINKLLSNYGFETSNIYDKVF